MDGASPDPRPRMSLPSVRTPLTPSQKAAVIVHLLLSEGADPGVTDLPPALQRRLARALGGLKSVDRGTVAEIVAEFAGQLDGAGLRLPGHLAGALAALDGRIAPEVMAELSAELADGPTDGVGGASWDALGALPPEALRAMLDAETPEVGAVLLSKLPAARAAGVLAQLDRERAAALTAAFAGTETVPPATVARIGLSLGGAVAATPPQAFATDAVARVGAILNAATSGARNAMLDDLDFAAPDFAARVRRAVFSWENIPDRLDPRDVPRVLRAVDNAAVLAAIGLDQEGPVTTFLLGAISPRLAEQMRGELEEVGRPKPDAAEAAQQAIASAVRAMAEKGDITLNAPEEAEDAPKRREGD